ncbi:alpha/beta fold hydrolase [Geodermatophilus ruber]|uniref:Pimeloyl-ACP methyl ester carboxylesterase n=1 Tax=Geodermatophilus ruber TaxID=504800 RepID=A0A1I4GMD5_9ACTN|nr:alpha/beta fold hydrolase [Geodermatophilus ruber]SFL31212.1 Pimeloyl-ACP methyl ester carboxylesterase [Geodermatophilus ruber]
MTIEDFREAAGPGPEAPARSIWLDLLGAEIRFRDVGGHLTRSVEAGAGEPVVLLHGISGHAETWVRTVTGLAQDFRVYALDMLGHGFTDKPPIEYSIQALGEHVLDFLDAVGVRAAHLVGQSLGGWVAAWLAATHPDRVASLVSVTGAGLQLTEDGAELTARVGRQVGDATRRALDGPTREKVRTRLEWLMHDPAVVTDELVEARYRIYTRPDFAAVAGRLVEAFTAGPRQEEMLTADRLRGIARPTLVLWTRQNPTMPWEVGERASRLIPGAAWYLMEDAGHWPQYEKPEEFLAVVGRFLRSVAGPADSTGGAA